MTIQQSQRGANGRYTGAAVGEPAALFDDTVPELPDRYADAETGQRAATTAPETWNPDSYTVEVIAATESPVRRKDARGAFLEVLAMDTLDLGAALDVPVFDHHRSGGARETIGITRALRKDGDKLVAVLRLSTADDAAPIVQRVAEGTVTGVSVGYAVSGWQESRADDGTRIKTPTRWTIREISLTPNPADPTCRVRSKETAPPTRRGWAVSMTTAPFPMR